MMAMPQPYSPHPGNLQQHPGMAGGGHPMAPGHPHGSQQGQAGMPQQMHMGVSGPGGPQVSQPGVSMGMQPGGAGIPGGPSAHALQHLNPNQTQMYQQQQMAFNPQFQQQMAQQHMIQQQQQQRQQHALRQAQAMQQYANGMPMTMPNGLNPNMSQAQFNAMRGAVPQNMRPVVALPQHLQAQQLQAQQGLEQQQAQQAAAQQQHQQMLAQQMAMQNAQSQAGNNPLQQNMSPQQMQNLQNAQLAAQQQQQQAQQQQQQQAQQQAQQQQQQQAQQAAQQQQQQQAAAVAAQQNQNQPQPQPPPQQNQQSQQNQQPQQPAPQPQAQPPQQQQQQPNVQQQQVAATAAMMQNRSRDSIKGHCILLLKQFGDHLSMFAQFTHPVEHYMSEGATRLEAQDQKQHADVGYWTGFVQRFFSPSGVYRHSILDHKELKDYQITVPALTRYFYTHFESGIKNMQLITEKASEKELPNHYYFLESPKASFIYWFDNGSHLVATGTLRAQFDPNQKIEMLEFITSSHEEYVPRTSVVEAIRPLHEWQKEWQKVNAPPDGKQSPETSKKAKPRPLKSPPNAPPEIELPDSKVKRNMGITPSVFRFLELAEVMGQMNPLFGFSHQNTALAPYAALDQYVANISATNGQNQQGMNPGLAQPGQRTPGVNQFNMHQSPATGNMSLPDGGGMMGSPAQGHMQAPGMALQQSQQGTSSSGPSANTSPNNNKRRRPSVKAESDTDGGIGQQPNGVPAKGKVNPSPRIGGKRQKGNPA